jgi:anti-sigma B factor antagonist
VTNAPEPIHRWAKPPADHRWPCPDGPGLDPAVGDQPAPSQAGSGPQRPWGLSVQHYPAAGICAIVVDGELDLKTAPLLEQRICQQLLAAPTHLILDLEPLHFLGSSGLNCLLRARQLAHTSKVQLHLAGLETPAVMRALKITGLLEIFHTYPSLIHAVIDLADQPQARPQHHAPPSVLTAYWQPLAGSVWVVELCQFDGDAGHGPVVDWINSGIPATQPAPDTAPELLAAYGLWLFPDPTTQSPTTSRHRIGHACPDANLITLAHLIHDEATQAGLHPITLAAWNAAGYSTQTALGWIRAGCPLPH